METNKQWKRVPHNLSLSTKIINGLIEGRIVSDKDGIVYIELPEEIPKHEFKPFDKVLVRQNEKDFWRAGIFSHINNDKGLGYGCVGGCLYAKCIPYEGNEHLVGTTNNPNT